MSGTLPSHGHPETKVFGLVGQLSDSDTGFIYLKRSQDSKNIGWDYAVQPTPTPSGTPPVTPTITPPSTNTPVPTNTPTQTGTPASTPPVTPTPGVSPTSTPPVTPTPGPTSTPGVTPTPSITPSPSALFILGLEGGPYISATGGGAYAPGTNVPISASSVPGNQFTQWVGGGGNLLYANTVNPNVVVMPSANVGIFVGTEEIPGTPGPYKLTISGPFIDSTHGEGFYAAGTYQDIWFVPTSGHDLLFWIGPDVGTLVRDNNQLFNTVLMPSHDISLTASMS